MHSEGALDMEYKTGFFLAEPLSTTNARKAIIKELDHICHLEKQLKKMIKTQVDLDIDDKTIPGLHNDAACSGDKTILVHLPCLEPTIRP